MDVDCFILLGMGLAARALLLPGEPCSFVGGCTLRLLKAPIRPERTCVRDERIIIFFKFNCIEREII